MRTVTLSVLLIAVPATPTAASDTYKTLRDVWMNEWTNVWRNSLYRSSTHNYRHYTGSLSTQQRQENQLLRCMASHEENKKSSSSTNKFILLWTLVFNFYWSIVALQCHVSFYCTAKRTSHLYTYIYPLFFGFPSHLGHHRALGRVSWSTKFCWSPFYLFLLLSLVKSPLLVSYLTIA